MPKLFSKKGIFIPVFFIFLSSLLALPIFSSSDSNSKSAEIYQNYYWNAGVYDYSKKGINSSQQQKSSPNDYYLFTTMTIGNTVYNVYRYYGNWYAILGGLDLSLPIYKGNTSASITQQYSKSYYSESSYNFGITIGGNAPMSIYQAAIQCNVGSATTQGRSFSVSFAVTYNIAVTDPAGYYKMGVCYDLNRHCVKSTGTSIVYEYDMPFSKDIPYIALLYCPSSSSGPYYKY
jgi:hypothetical protein